MHAFVVTLRPEQRHGPEHRELETQLAPAFAAVPGPRLAHSARKPRHTCRFGAFYVFDSLADFDRFVASELYAATHHGPGLTASDLAISSRGGQPQ